MTVCVTKLTSRRYGNYQGGGSWGWKSPGVSEPTLKGLIKALIPWLNGSGSQGSAELVAACKQMAGVLAKARLDTEADLKKSGLDDELAAPLRQTMEAYADMVQAVASLVKSVAAEDRKQSRRWLVALQTAARSLLAADAEMQTRLEGSSLRCPSCGASDIDPCPTCGLELVYGRPRRRTDPGHTSTPLPSTRLLRATAMWLAPQRHSPA